jgi:1D-myo-inositol-triphosphate 3-kinase
MEQLIIEESAASEKARYMRLTNLMKQFQRGPHVMDCKIGIRCYTEDEVNSTKPRPDLFQRLQSIDPGWLTPEEFAAGACTKLRWMSYNDTVTTTQSLGFRIDGVANSNGKVPKKEIRMNTTTGEIADFIIESVLPCDGLDDDPEKIRNCKQATRTIVARLKELRRAFQSSAFVKRHSFIGCSVLFVVDAHGPTASVNLIDFAKLQVLPEGVCIDHSSPWQPGNYEDGLFIGANSLLAVWEEVDRQLSKYGSDG